MNSVSIERLFDFHRFSSWPAFINIILYSPIGLLLAVIRFFIGCQVYILASILPKSFILRSFILRTMCCVLGIIIKQDGVENRDENVRVLVANYTTRVDYIALSLVQPHIMVSIWDLPEILSWLLGYHDLGAKHGRETLIQNAKKHCTESDIPLLSFPEGATTNGKAGLLKFSIWPFSLDQPVQPIAFHLSRPDLFEISPSLLGSHFWADIFWFIFVPYTIFHIRYLPVEQLEDDETPQEFAKRVQVRMCDTLGIRPTHHTSSDKMELLKRQNVSSEVRTTDTAEPQQVNHALTELDKMVDQVKVVLPNVPTGTIRNDLALTKDIDLTITNILEGRVKYTEEEASIEADRESSPPPTRHVQSTTKPAESAPRPSIMPNCSATFGKNSKERHLSFEERKKAMIEHARQRYLEKQKSALNSPSS